MRNKRYRNFSIVWDNVRKKFKFLKQKPSRKEDIECDL